MRLLNFFIVLFFMVGGEAARASDIHYAPATYRNLSNLIYKYGGHDTQDQDVISDYMRVFYCSLYEKYQNDEFLMAKILQAKSREFTYFSGDIPARLEVVSYIPIEGYDFKKSVFPIVSDFALDNGSGIMLSAFGDDALPSNDMCFTASNSHFFPRDIRFVSENKFELTEIPVSPDKADAFIERLRAYDYDSREYERIVPVRFRIRINGIREFNFSTGPARSHIVFDGQLEQLTVFEDPQLKREIWSKQYKKFD